METNCYSAKVPKESKDLRLQLVVSESHEVLDIRESKLSIFRTMEMGRSSNLKGMNKRIFPNKSEEKVRKLSHGHISVTIM
jgi:hypothetical protein